jgi:hypothetical protein
MSLELQSNGTLKIIAIGVPPPLFAWFALNRQPVTLNVVPGKSSMPPPKPSSAAVLPPVAVLLKNWHCNSVVVSPRPNVPIYLDHARPAGSTGLVEAELTLAYDPKVLSVSAADITFGSLPSQGTGWQLSAVVNSETGEITIQRYSGPSSSVPPFRLSLSPSTRRIRETAPS